MLPDPLLEKLAFLESSIHDIDQQIQEREEQNRKDALDMDRHHQEIRDAILRRDAMMDYSSRRRSELEHESRMLQNEMRQRWSECWRDIAELQRERRQLEKELWSVRSVQCLPWSNYSDN